MGRESEGLGSHFWLEGGKAWQARTLAGTEFHTWYLFERSRCSFIELVHICVAVITVLYLYSRAEDQHGDCDLEEAMVDFMDYYACVI